MADDLLLRGMINGMEQMGATFIKNDTKKIYFTIKIGSEIDDEEKLKKAKGVWMRAFGLTVMIKKVP